MKIQILSLFLIVLVATSFPSQSRAEDPAEDLAYVYSCDGNVVGISVTKYKPVVGLNGSRDGFVNSTKDGCPLTSLFATDNPRSLLLITPVGTEAATDGASRYQLNWIDSYSGKKVSSVMLAEPLVRFPEIIDVLKSTEGATGQLTVIIRFSTKDDDHLASITLQPKLTSHDVVESLVANEAASLRIIKPSLPEWAQKYLPEPGWMTLQLSGSSGVFVREIKDNTQFAALDSANDLHKLNTLSNISASRVNIVPSGEHLFALAADNILWKLKLHPLEIDSMTHINAKGEDTKVLCVSDVGAFVKTADRLLFVKRGEVHSVDAGIPIDDQLQCVFEKKQ